MYKYLACIYACMYICVACMYHICLGRQVGKCKCNECVYRLIDR